jgi:hypothetical protein
MSFWPGFVPAFIMMLIAWEVNTGKRRFAHVQFDAFKMGKKSLPKAGGSKLINSFKRN